MDYQIKKVGLKMDRKKNEGPLPSVSVKIVNGHNQVEKRNLFKNNLKKTVYFTNVTSFSVLQIANSTSQSLFWRLQLKFFVKFLNKINKNVLNNEISFENYELKYKKYIENNNNEGVVMINKFDFNKGSMISKKKCIK
jgi:hypothetical protein